MIETLLDAEEMRRRCDDDNKWVLDHVEAAAIAEAWADRKLDELTNQ